MVTQVGKCPLLGDIPKDAIHGITKNDLATVINKCPEHNNISFDIYAGRYMGKGCYISDFVERVLHFY